MTEGGLSNLQTNLIYEYILQPWPLAKELMRLDSNEDLAASVSLCSLDSNKVLIYYKDNKNDRNKDYLC